MSCSDAGTQGNVVDLVSEPSGLGEMCRNLYGSMDGASVSESCSAMVICRERRERF